MQGIRILWNGLKEVWRGLKVPSVDPKIEEDRKTANSLYWQKQYQSKKAKKGGIIGLILLLALMLAGCQGPKAIVNATLRDTIFSVEPRANGATSIWMTHDDVGTYCTFDTKLAADALAILKSANPEVIITYRSINSNDPEWAWLGDMNGNGCPQESGQQSTIYKLLTIQRPGE